MSTKKREQGDESGHGKEQLSLRCVAILPARLGSTRLPRKMLLDESGLPLIVHSARNAARCSAFERVVVATDSDEVLAACSAHDVECVLTRADHPSGTDRVQEALEQLQQGGRPGSFDVVVNVQGDEPDVEPDDLTGLCRAFVELKVQVATLCAPIETEQQWRSPHVVKVVRDDHGDALFFSRAAIPDGSHSRPGAPAPLEAARRHLGVYAFRPGALARYCALGPSAYEQLESLEQLRWLQAGEKMRVLPATHVPIGIDTPADYEAFVALETSGKP
ncbi:MAG: 3-deoxy-manno-octulosonate cytidylyltransferase (CMP-KDO synthetase) [Chlamydiales bacterium]|jgi:3-deoxy-manno-octulosonate cytidylyltransferase (CMP-KDO synthetase)